MRRLPGYPQGGDEQDAPSKALPGWIACEKLGDLGEREYKYQVKEQLERFNGPVA